MTEDRKIFIVDQYLISPAPISDTPRFKRQLDLQQHEPSAPVQIHNTRTNDKKYLTLSYIIRVVTCENKS